MSGTWAHDRTREELGTLVVWVVCGHSPRLPQDSDMGGDHRAGRTRGWKSEVMGRT